MDKRLIRNKARCGLCGDIIESTYRHDWVSCSCGNIFVDGGLDYQRCGVKDDFNTFIDLSEYEEEHESFEPDDIGDK